MFKTSLSATVAALTLATAFLCASAQAGGLGKLIAAGVIGAVAGSVVASRARSHEHGYRPEYRPVRGGFDEGCGVRARPVFDEFGQQVGTRRVPAC